MSQANSQHRKIKILLIDDDEDDFILTRDLLENIEYFDIQLDWEDNYKKAQTLISKNNHDLYLIDYRLGEGDGISLISHAVNHGNFRPMILLTGKGDREIDIQAMQEGASDYMIKGEMTSFLMERSIRYALNNNMALQMVREGEAKFRQLFERSIDPIFVSDNELRFVDYNPSLTLLFGYTDDELDGKKLESLFENKQQYINLNELLTNQNAVKKIPVTLLTKEGEKVDCQITCLTRNNHENEPIGYQGIIHDITLQKKTEQELVVSARLNMTGKIARSIAHEVRNPLSNVGLALEQLEDEIGEKTEDVAMFFDIIKRNTHRISQLITEMLNSSRPKTLKKVTHSVNDVILEAIELVKDRLTLKDMQVTQELERSSTQMLLDKNKLQIALVNIFVNAIEAMEVKKGVLHISTKTKSDHVCIEIKDNGCGISPEEIDNLFDAFFTKKPSGMGLGLTNTQSIIHGHKGTIEVTSELGEGTTFSICLPRVDGNGHN